MKTKTKPLCDLYFRFLKGTPLEDYWDAQTAALVLAEEGLITLIAHNSEPRIEHYQDTTKMRVETALEILYGPEPDIDICSDCGEHATFVQGQSNCCGAGSYDTDPDIDMER